MLAKLLVVTGLARALRKEHGTAIALRPEAVGMPELIGGVHAQAFRAVGCAIRVAWHLVVGMLVERDGGNAPARCASLVGVPGVEGSISGDVDGKGIEHGDGLDVKRHKVGDVVLVKRLREISKHHITIDGIGGCCDAGPVAPDEFLFFFGGAIGLHLIGALFDPPDGNRGRWRAAGLS